MRTPPALPRLALGPLLLATALGPVGFAAGWVLHPGTDAPPAATPPPSRADVVAVGGVPSAVSNVPTQITPATARATRSRPTPDQARERLVAWVAAGCPRGEAFEILELLDAWANADPREALTFVHTAPQFRGRTGAYAFPLARIGETDPAEVTAWIDRELPDPAIQEAVMGNVIRMLIADHPKSALELAQGGTVRNAYLAARAFERFAERDPPAALAWFDQRLTDEERARHAAELATGWLRLDAAAARAWCLQQAGTPYGESVLHRLASHLAENAPEELGSLLNNPAFSTGARTSILHQIGDSHPDIALELLPTLPPENARGVFLGMFESLFSEDPAAAIDLGRSLLTEDILLRRVGSSWSRWQESDQPAAQAWAATIADPKVRHQLEFEQARSLIGQAPDAYLATLASMPQEPEARSLATLALSLYANQSPHEAAAWLAAHLDSIDAQHAATIAEAYVYRDGADAVAWARTLPAGPARDAAHAALIDQGTQRGESAGLEVLLHEISDPVIQTRATYRLFRAMPDRDAAERWLESQPLPAEVRASWLAIASAGDVAIIMQSDEYPYE